MANYCRAVTKSLRGTEVFFMLSKKKKVERPNFVVIMAEKNLPRVGNILALILFYLARWLFDNVEYNFFCQT